MPTAVLHEIFASRQGEGLYTGDPMVFVRFQGCPFTCSWCDTPGGLPTHSSTFYIEDPSGRGRSREQANPCTAEALTTLLRDFPPDPLALTGGEPLAQADFLRAWLPALRANDPRRILLETAGLHTKALAGILPWIDIISMDLKLPSSTGMAPCWEAHQAFLHTACAGTATVYVKLVVTATTTTDDVTSAARLIAAEQPHLPTYLQIVTPGGDTASPDDTQIADWVDRLRAHLGNVVVGRQMHKVWGVR